MGSKRRLAGVIGAQVWLFGAAAVTPLSAAEIALAPLPRPALTQALSMRAVASDYDPLRSLAPPPALALRASDDGAVGTIERFASLAEGPAASAAPLRLNGTPAQPDAAGSAPFVPVPDLPLPAVIDAAAPEGGSAIFADAIARFAAPDPSRWPGMATGAARQRQKDREAIAAYYAAHANAPLWLDGSRLAPAARAALSRIDRAGEDGLGLAAYAVPALRDADPATLAETDLAISEAVVAYAKQASGSRIDPLQINRLITAKPGIPEVAAILDRVAKASDADAALRDFNPPQPAYDRLRRKLAELRQQDVPVARETIPSGPTLKPGMRDARVPLIRSRFGLDLPSAEDAAADGLVYDTKVAAAVADFQRSKGLPASGILNPKTIAALSGGNPSRLESELVANMERWRWLPRDLGPDHISVNVPDYALEVVQNGAVVHRARVVVGKPDHQTPIFSDLMRFIIVNPYWNVPLSIIKKEMMPKLAENPDYFADHGYEVVERDGQTYVRQPPGDDNALGRIKFMFPNQHSVYLHDTNARALFGKDKRAFSHGCVRVDQPFKLAEVVLGRDNGWPEARIKKLIGGSERTIALPKPLPIHITYFTASVDDDGGLRLRDDVYGYSGRVKAALGLVD